MRGKQAKKRGIKPDRKYDSVLVSKLINKVMIGGKKKVAQTIVYKAIEDVAKQLNETPMVALERAITNVKPVVEVRARRVGGSNYQIPVPVPANRQISLAIRWLVEIARAKKGGKFGDFLKNELVQAYKNGGEAVKKRENVEKMAEANRAFAHFRW